MPRWRYFAIEDDKVTKKFGLFLKNYRPLTSLTSLSFLTSLFFVSLQKSDELKTETK
jgi:hypothetical protein